jgi:DNA polymerase epsilon subunit 2
MEREAEDAMLVFVSDVYLDDDVVLGKLRAMLEGFNSSGAVPAAFVLMGPFSRHAYGQDLSARLTGTSWWMTKAADGF